MTSNAAPVSSSPVMPPAAGASPVVKTSFVVIAALLILGLFSLKLREYVRYLDFTALAVMDPLPLERAAPPFSLPPGPEGTPLTLQGLQGKPVLLHFWATWCPPCREELASLEYLSRQLLGKVEVIAVTVDDDWAEVERFFGGQAPTFKLAWDKDRAASEAYGTAKFPETYLIGPDGQLRTKFIGARDWNSQAALHYLQGQLGS